MFTGHAESRAVISIHALFAEGDAPAPPLRGRTGYFYPRPLRRGRLYCHIT